MGYQLSSVSPTLLYPFVIPTLDPKTKKLSGRSLWQCNGYDRISISYNRCHHKKIEIGEVLAKRVLGQKNTPEAAIRLRMLDGLGAEKRGSQLGTHRILLQSVSLTNGS